MVFNSGIFFYFLLLVMVVYFTIGQFSKSSRPQNFFLLIASYIFYGWWDWIFLLLIFISTIVDYFAARNIEKSIKKIHKKIFLFASVIVNLGMLAAFKYFDFFVNSLVGSISFFWPDYNSNGSDWLLLKVLLPVGISFYTFQTLSYTIDVYRGQIKAEKNFFDFALFVSFFPQLVAGPIERAGDLLPQLKQKRSINVTDLQAGAWLILYGLFMKTFVADSLAPVADSVFLENRSLYLANRQYIQYLGGPQVFLASIAFTFQIYCDFAGYSTIALGTARLLGVRLTLNFETPQFSTNPVELWRRWHVTLNRWITDYVYITFGGSRHGEFKKYRNLFLVFILTGLWHGANWTFIVWGAYIGIWMISYLLIIPHWKPVNDNQSPMKRRLKKTIFIGLCFLGFAMSAPLFRAWDIQQSFDLYSRMFMFPREIFSQAMNTVSDPAIWPLGRPNLAPKILKMAGSILRHVWLLLIIDYMWYRKNDIYWIFKKPLWFRVSLYSLLYFIIVTMGVFGKDVIYFAF